MGQVAYFSCMRLATTCTQTPYGSLSNQWFSSWILSSSKFWLLYTSVRSIHGAPLRHVPKGVLHVGRDRGNSSQVRRNWCSAASACHPLVQRHALLVWCTCWKARMHQQWRCCWKAADRFVSALPRNHALGQDCRAAFCWTARPSNYSRAVIDRSCIARCWCFQWTRNAAAGQGVECCP